MACLDSSNDDLSTTNADVQTLVTLLPTDVLDPGKCQNRPPVLASRSPLRSSRVEPLSQTFLISREYVEFEIPTPFRRVVLNALTASPASVDLRTQSAQFYAFAEKVMNL
jgi:hypothetical protein